MSGERIALITGSTDGLGRETARRLAAEGATVLVHGRDEGRVRATLDQIGTETPARLGSYVADLASLADVRRLAQQVEADHGRLNVLVNNAGIGARERERRLSEDGHELTFAVNYLSHFLLTMLLLPVLERSAPARIVNVASIGQQAIDFDDVMLEKGYEPFRAYCQSKLAQVMFTFELAQRLGNSGVTVNALHPATLMDTKMVRDTFGRTLSTVKQGADATVRLAWAPDVEDITGLYYDGTSESTAHEQAYDPDARRRLWELSERLCGLTGR